MRPGNKCHCALEIVLSYMPFAQGIVLIKYLAAEQRGISFSRGIGLGFNTWKHLKTKVFRCLFINAPEGRGIKPSPRITNRILTDILHTVYRKYIIFFTGGTIKLKTIFIVDNNDAYLLSMYKTLSRYYHIFTLSSAIAMFELLEEIIPDLILLDIEMCEINGFEAFEAMKINEKNAEIPVIFLAENKDVSKEARAFELGALDFIHKPFFDQVLVNRIKAHLKVKSLNYERMEKHKRLENGIVSILANIVENRDHFTGKHVERTTKYIKILLEAMIRHNVYSLEINQWNMDTVISSVRLHDIGKIVISDLLLNKQGTLTTDEFEIMKTHTTKGENIIENIIAESGDGYFLQHAKLFAGYHHERWDGTGYPHGLMNEDIPLQGRIMAIIDVYDALVSERPYKPAFSHEKAVEIINESRNKHFDPKIADVFIENNNLFVTDDV